MINTTDRLDDSQGTGTARATIARDPAIPLSKNIHLLKWVDKMAHLTLPDAIHWVDGSREEYDSLCEQMVQTGT